MQLKTPQTGDFLPAFKGLTSKNVVLTNDTLEGQFWLVEFWASWCRPCRVQNQYINRMLEDFRQADTTFKDRFGVIGIALDEDVEVWQKAIRNDVLEWSYHLTDTLKWEGEIVETFGITYIPYNFLVDAKGIIVSQGLHGESLRLKISEILKVP